MNIENNVNCQSNNNEDGKEIEITIEDVQRKIETLLPALMDRSKTYLKEYKSPVEIMKQIEALEEMNSLPGDLKDAAWSYIISTNDKPTEVLLQMKALEQIKSLPEELSIFAQKYLNKGFLPVEALNKAFKKSESKDKEGIKAILKGLFKSNKQ